MTLLILHIDSSCHPNVYLDHLDWTEAESPDRPSNSMQEWLFQVNPDLILGADVVRIPSE